VHVLDDENSRAGNAVLMWPAAAWLRVEPADRSRELDEPKLASKGLFLVPRSRPEEVERFRVA
jgi:hypothetical protein